MSSQLQQTWSDQSGQNISRNNSKPQQNSRTGMNDYSGMGISKSVIGFAQYRGLDHNDVKRGQNNDPLEMPRIKTPQV